MARAHEIEVPLLSRSLLSSTALVDLDCLVQDLVEVCRSPVAMTEPEVGRATLAVSAVTALCARIADTQADLSRTQADVQEAFRQAHEAIARARSATDRARQTRERARTIMARGHGLRPRVEAAAPFLRGWLTTRQARVACGACRGAVVVRYQYRFMEGLAARELLCPWRPCAGAITFYLPVNSFGLSVSRAD